MEEFESLATLEKDSILLKVWVSMLFHNYCEEKKMLYVSVIYLQFKKYEHDARRNKH
jgi:hypothetical protein